MSMDILVWSVTAPALPQDLPKAAEWAAFGDSYEYDSGEWLLSVQTSPGTPEASILKTVPNAAFETWIFLEPIGASEAAYAFLETVTRQITSAAGGVWVHPGNGQAYRHNEGQF